MAKPRKRKKPRAKGKRRDAPKKATVLIPLTYNDGTKIPKDVLLDIFEQMYLAFHGWTEEGKVKGAYRMQSGEKRVEYLLKVSVVLNHSQVPELGAMVSAWCASLGQEAMLLEITDHTVKFVPPREEVEES